MVYRKWTIEDDDYLRENKDKPSKELARILGREKKSVTYRKDALGITEKRNIWTKKDDDYLRENYKEKTTKEISKFLGRNTVSISKRILILGLTFGKSQRALRWTKEQEEIVRINYLTKSDSEIAKLIGKTRCAVEGYRHFKKLFKPKVSGCGLRSKWKNYEEKILKEYSVGKNWLPSSILHEKYLPSRSSMAIQTRRNILGLKESVVKITKECENCHKKFEVFPCKNNKRFCSKKCWIEDIRTNRNRGLSTSITLDVNNEMLDFLDKKGNQRCNYIRGLIEADMKNELR